MDTFGKAIAYTLNVILFMLLSIIFLPAFLITQYLQETWSKMLGDLF